MKGRTSLAVLVVAAMAALGNTGIQAATFTVSNLNNTGAGSLRQAILDANAAPGSDMVVFQAGLTGTIVLTSGGLTIQDSLVIQGPGANALAVSGNNATRPFSIEPGHVVTISGLTIKQGHFPGGGGGGIFSAGSNLTLSNCNFSGNSAGFGGGIFIHSGAVTLNNCTFSANSVTGNGGALSNGGGAIGPGGFVTASNCTFFANSAGGNGGGIATSPGRVVLINSTIAGNGAAGNGGGIHNDGSLELTGCTINGNIATAGGGLFNQGTIIIEGPAPAAANASTATLVNSTLSGNRAFNGGGILNQSDVSMTNCTLAHNAADQGSGVYISSLGKVTLGNTILANSLPGGNCFSEAGGATISRGHNLDSDGICGLSQPGDQNGTPATPLDPGLGPLQDNGGPTDTHALLPGSLALDAGDDTLVPASITTDQRGFPFPRIADGTNDGDANVDIGAFELSFFRFNPVDVAVRPQFLAYSTIGARETRLPAGTGEFNLTLHYSPEIAPRTFVAMLNGQNITHLFHPDTPDGFETVAIPLRAGQNRLILRVKGQHDGRPAQEVDNLAFHVGEPPFGPR